MQNPINNERDLLIGRIPLGAWQAIPDAFNDADRCVDPLRLFPTPITIRQNLGDPTNSLYDWFRRYDSARSFLSSLIKLCRVDLPALSRALRRQVEYRPDFDRTNWLQLVKPSHEF